MVKKYKIVLPQGREKQICTILGRPYTLVNGAIVTEGVISKLYPSLLKPIEEEKEVKKVHPEEFVKEVKIEEDKKVEEVKVVEETKTPSRQRNRK